MPALSLRNVEETAPALVSLYKSAAVSLEKHGLDDEMAAVYLVVDYSGSMRPYFRNGSVQALADRVLGLSAHLDDDGRVPVVFFSTGIDAETEIAELAVPQYRCVDNAGFFAAGTDPRRMSDAQLYDRLLGEFPHWLRSARAEGIVR